MNRMNVATDRDKHVLLRKADIFSTLGEQELDVIEKYSEFRTYPVHSTIFEAGSVGDELYIVADGEVVIRRLLESGDELDVARYIAGDSFGEMDLLNDAPRNASALTETEATLLVFPYRERRFESILEEHPILSAQILHKFMAIVAGRIRSTNKLISENTPWIQELRKQVLGDKLTGFYNSTYLREEFPRILAAGNGPTALLMVKPDNFKHINDTYGHEIGDESIKTICAALRTCLRPEDGAVRYRGNEIAIIRPETTRNDAAAFAEHVLSTMSAIDLSGIVGGPEGTLPLTASVSFGIFPEEGSDPDALVELVHDRLYQARDAGGNQVICR